MASEVEALLEQAQARLDALEVEAALEMCVRACSLEPTNAAALAMLGDVSLQAGDMERARAALQRSVELMPEGGGARFMTLGQLSEGADALKLEKVPPKIGKLSKIFSEHSQNRYCRRH